MYRYIAPLLLLLFIPLFFLDRSPHIKDLQYDRSQHVNDFCHIINQHDRDSIEALCNDLLRLKKINIVVATIKSTDGRVAAAYAVDLANKWKIEGENGAILIMIVPSQRTWQVKVSNQLQCLLTDLHVVQIGKKYMLPYLRKSNYGVGIISYVRALSDRIISDDDKLQVLDLLQKSKAPNKKTKIFTMINSTLPVVLLIFTLVMIYVVYKYQTKKIMKASSLALERQQHLNSIINRSERSMIDCERFKRYNPTLTELREEFYALRCDCLLTPGFEIDHLAKREIELTEKAAIAMTKAELVCNVSALVAGIPKIINEMNQTVHAVGKEYEEGWDACSVLMMELPDFELGDLCKKQSEKILALGIDLDNAIKLFDTAKFGPIQGAINNARRKFDEAVIEHRNAISTVQQKVNFVSNFELQYRNKINQSIIHVTADYVTPSSRISFENLVPVMLEMLDRLAKTTNFTYKYALCKEIETTYNSAVAGFTKELAEHNKKQTNNNDQS